MTSDDRSDVRGGPPREIAIEQGGGKPPLVVCPECGAENIQGTDYCTNCNSDLRTLDIPPETWSPAVGPPGESVGHLGHRDPLTVEPSTTVADAIAALREAGRGCAVVVEGGRAVGIFTERDVLHKVTRNREALLGASVNDVMTPNPMVVREDESVLVALNQMAVGGFRDVPFVDQDGALTGLLSGRDVLEYIATRAQR